jgi:hypothetical protein
MFTLAGGDWGLAVLIWRTAKREIQKILLILSKKMRYVRG